MKKILLIIMIVFLAFGSFAKDNFDRVNTVYTNIPVRIVIKQDSTFSVILNKYDEQYIQYEIINDTVLKITRKGINYEDYDELPIVRIKTPRTLNVECSNYLKINN